MERIKRILIIDDDDTSVFLTKRVLNSMGIGSNVKTAKNGVDGLNLLKELKEKGDLPQLILLDVKMHVMGGFAFLDELSKRDYVNLIDTRIILLSGYKDPNDLVEAGKHMTASYLQKPLTKDKLLSVLDSY